MKVEIDDSAQLEPNPVSPPHAIPTYSDIQRRDFLTVSIASSFLRPMSDTDRELLKYAGLIKWNHRVRAYYLRKWAEERRSRLTELISLASAHDDSMCVSR